MYLNHQICKRKTAPLSNSKANVAQKKKKKIQPMPSNNNTRRYFLDREWESYLKWWMAFWVCLTREMATRLSLPSTLCVFPSELGEAVRLALISHYFCTFFEFCLCDMARHTWRDLNGLHVTESSIVTPFLYLPFRGIDLVSPFSLLTSVFCTAGNPTQIKSQLFK